MTVLFYLNLMSLESYSHSKDMITKTGLIVDKIRCLEVFCKKAFLKMSQKSQKMTCAVMSF